MLVDINLLPEKEKKNYALFVLIFFLIIAAVLGWIMMQLHYNNVKNEAQYIQKQIDDTKLLRTLQEKNLTDYTSSTAYAELEAAIQWTEKLPISTVLILRHISSLLPERGFILNFNYTDEGTVNTLVQFDTSREAAYYLKSLKDSEFIEKVNLTSLVTSNSEDSLKVSNIKNVLLPRYIGQFTLTLNKPALKTAEEEGES
jgi:type IV pilus assembly protein PilN